MYEKKYESLQFNVTKTKNPNMKVYKHKKYFLIDVIIINVISLHEFTVAKSTYD